MQVVVSDKPSCGGVQYAEAHNIKSLTFPIPKNGSYPGLTEDQVVDELKIKLNIDFVILAGYLKVRRWQTHVNYPESSVRPVSFVVQHILQSLLLSQRARAPCMINHTIMHLEAKSPVPPSTLHCIKVCTW